MERLAVQPTGRKKKRSDNYKQRVETETSDILETPEREQNSTSELSEDPDRILVEKIIIPVSDTVKQDPVKKTPALKQGEVADDCCSTSEPSEDPHTYIHTLLQLPKEGFSVTRLLINLTNQLK